MGGGRSLKENGEMGDNSEQKNQTGNGSVKNSDEDEYEIVPPDGGWGWVVVFASFLIHVIADGIVYSFGIFYIEFLHYYKGGRGETAWVGSLVPGVTLTVGPIASVFTNKYGCRATTIAGAVIAAAGFALSLLAPNLYFLYFSFGIMAGLGFGLIYLPAIVSVGYYFEEKRAFATGLAVCGSGLGAFIFNPFSKYLIDEFGWRGAILIEAGIILNCVLCGALFRPLQPTKKRKKDVDVEAVKKTTSNKKTPTELARDKLEMELLVKSSPGITTLDNGKIMSQPSSPTKEANPEFNNELLFRSETALNKRSVAGGAAGDGHRQHQIRRLISEESGQHHHRHLTPGGIYMSGSLVNISLQRSHPALYIQSLTSIPCEETTSKKRILCFTVSSDMFNSMKQMCDFSLLKDTIFLMFVVSNFFTSIGFNMPFIFLTDRAIDEGISGEDAKWLVSAIGISNTVGRVVFGFLADRKGVNRLMLYNTALTICGVATALCPLCYNYPLLIVYACVFGLFIGVYVSLTSVVLVDLLGLDMLTNSFGLLLMFQGFATLIGPPIAGWLYDGTGSYDYSFIVAGVIVATSGVMLFFIPLVRKCLHREPVIAMNRNEIDEVEINVN